ncbi:PREDICTED: uncharacterized protein LOC107066140 [Polistes dominula]|uniref:Uncharacterized protein LOC107066140 n=1 Tax=Polistes dominula TaxID=743375 RepID=A0ABM1I6X8_POLDO|nr:PREDICTED: uncharacterized protein LOC107066140 [Polistes dominula]
MAGDEGAPKTNNEIFAKEGEEVRGALARGEPHSRVGGILECDPPGNRNSPSKQQACSAVVAAAGTVSNEAEDYKDEEESEQELDERDGSEGEGGGIIYRYAIRTATSVMSFIEMCQIRLQYLFPQLTPPPRYRLCENSIEYTAECLANDVIRYLLKEDIYRISRDPISRSMRHNVYRMLNKHNILFTSMVNRLNVSPDTAYETFRIVADELFIRGVTWAKIVCLYTFTGRLALWARDRRMTTLKQKLPIYISRYIADEIAIFIKEYGWEQLCEEYPVAEETSDAIWRSLVMTGAALSLVTAILTATS